MLAVGQYISGRAVYKRYDSVSAVEQCISVRAVC